MEKTQKPLKFRLILLTGLALLAFFIFSTVESDPSVFKKLGDIGDEGYWIHNAKNKVLHGHYLQDELNQALVGAPLYNAVTTASFSLLGVNLFAARFMVGVFYLAGILLVFLLVRREFSLKQAVIFTLSLGFMHELLMQLNWSTPIFFEIFFHLLFFFLVTREWKKRFLYFIAGLVYILALMSKLSAVYFFPVVVLYMALLFVYRRDLFRHIFLPLFSGLCTGTMLYVLLFALPFYEQLSFFTSSIGRANYGTPDITYWGDIFYNFMFIYPSIAVLCILCLLSFSFSLPQIFRKGLATVVQRCSLIELFSVCWLLAAFVVFVFSADRSERRFAMLIYPLAIEALFFIQRTWNLVQEKTKTIGIEELLRAAGMAALAGGYAYFSIVNIYYLYFYEFMPDVYLDEHMYIYTLLGLVVLVLLLLKKTKVLITASLVLYFGFLFFANGLWYTHRSYTLRDTNAQLDHLYAGETYSTGLFCHLLSYNHLQPVWYLKPKLSRNYGPINLEYYPAVRNKNLVVTDCEIMEGAPAENIFGPPAARATIQPNDFSNGEMEKTATLKLFPYPGLDKYRMVIGVYKKRSP